MLSESNMKPTEFLERIQEVKDLDISFIYKEDVNFEEEKEEYPLLDTASSIQFMEKNQPHEKLVREQDLQRSHSVNQETLLVEQEKRKERTSLVEDSDRKLIKELFEGSSSSSTTMETRMDSLHVNPIPKKPISNQRHSKLVMIDYILVAIGLSILTLILGRWLYK
jgi:hypothetical protein